MRRIVDLATLARDRAPKGTSTYDELDALTELWRPVQDPIPLWVPVAVIVGVPVLLAVTGIVIMLLSGGLDFFI